MAMKPPRRREWERRHNAHLRLERKCPSSVWVNSEDLALETDLRQ